MAGPDEQPRRSEVCLSVGWRRRGKGSAGQRMLPVLERSNAVVDEARWTTPNRDVTVFAAQAEVRDRSVARAVWARSPRLPHKNMAGRPSETEMIRAHAS